MSEFVYTIGRTSSYDEAVADAQDHMKLGKRGPSQEFPEGYDGGWVWKTPAEANTFRVDHLREFEPEWDPTTFSVYKLELPTSWEVDVYKSGSSVYSSLLNDSKIVCRVD
jgi:hypothetical protein